MFNEDQKLKMIERVTDAIVDIEGEAMRSVTWVLIEEVQREHWAIGGSCPDQGEMLHVLHPSIQS